VAVKIFKIDTLSIPYYILLVKSVFRRTAQPFDKTRFQVNTAIRYNSDCQALK